MGKLKTLNIKNTCPVFAVVILLYFFILLPPLSGASLLNDPVADEPAPVEPVRGEPVTGEPVPGKPVPGISVPAENQFSNKPITDVQIVVNDLDMVPQIRYLFGLRIGDPFSQERVDEGIDRLKMLNVFSSVQVEKHLDHSGVRLTVTLHKQSIIKKIGISGNYPLFKNEVRKVISVRIGDRFDFQTLRQNVSDIERLYQSEGYYQARVSIQSNKSGEEIDFQIDKGLRTRINTVEFEEDGKRIKDDLGFQSILEVYSGNVLREARLKRNIRQLEGVLVNQGFLKAKVYYQVTHLSPSYALLKVIIDRGQRIQVRFKGNNHISDAQIRGKITLFENRSHTEQAHLVSDLQESIEDIKKLYLERGFLFVKASYEKKIQGNQQDNQDDVEVTFLIQEGKRVLLDRITLEGNKGISTKKLRGQMLILQKTTPFRRNVFNPRAYEEDLKALKALYAFEGYPWAEVRDGKTIFSSDQRLISKTIYIHEGSRVVVDEVAFHGNQLFDDSVLRKNIALKLGGAFTEKKWQEDRKRLAIFYSNHGYVFVKVTPQVKFNKERGSVKLSYTIDEGPEAFFGKSIIRRNVRTRYYVIRNSLVFSEGEPFSYQKIIESNKNLSDLGIFRTVRVKPIDLEKREKNVDILVEVEEMDTGKANVGVGFNSIQGYRGYLELQEENLFGTSLGTTLRLEYSGIGKEYDLSSEVKYTQKISLGIHDSLLVPKQKIDGNLNLFDIYEEKTGYNLRQDGLKISLGKLLHKTTHLSLTYRLEDARLSSVESGANIPESDKELTISSIKPVLSFDTRDNFFNPQRGILAQIGLESAGEFMGGDSSFSKLTASISEFFPLSRKLVLALKISGGYASVSRHSTIPIQERFYAGGLNSIRGYREDSVGPIEENVPTGGKFLLVNNVEFRYNLYRRLNGVIFFDAGNVWDKSLDDKSVALTMRTSAGSGLRLVTPVGPIRLDYAWVLGRKKGEPKGKFYISIGHMF